MDLTLFNPEQKQAITLPISPQEVPDILVLAGAGSGKTRVLTYRIAYLHEQGIPLSQVLAVTFTKKAANEMKERLAKLVPPGSRVKMGTFHSIANDILRTYYDRPFDIIDDGDQTRMLRRIIKHHEEIDNASTKKVKSWLSYQRSKCLDPLQPSLGDSDEVKAYRQVVQIYYEEKTKLGEGVMDFDDLLEKAVEMLHSNERVRRQLQARWKYLLVDEYQDTNTRQFEFISLLRGENAQLLHVGDEDQLIYSWRGAEIKHIISAYKASLESPHVTCITLHRNYRCSANILSLANEVVEMNTQRTGKALSAHKSAGKPVGVYVGNDESDEAAFIARRIAKWQEEGVALSDIAILYRTNRMARPIEAGLIEEGLAYKLYNGVAIFDSVEVRLMMALLWFAYRPDEAYYLDIINDTIKMRLGMATLLKHNDKRLAAKQDWVAYLEANPKLGNRAHVDEFIELVRDAQKFLAAGMLCEAAQNFLYRGDLMRFYKEEARENKAKTLDLFFTIIGNYEHECQTRNATPTVPDFQENRLLNDEVMDGEKANQVQVMTIHKAKGLEFKRGFIVGMQDGVFPMLFDEGEEENEEDRRLAYVAITRFMDELVLTRAGFRVGYKQLDTYSSLVDPSIRGLLEKGVVSEIYG
jgi:DNA helicase II / ATP-dependent DNA helicase PcrA